MNLLLTCPARRILYYGDEIGMGDNICSAIAMACAPPCSGRRTQWRIFHRGSRSFVSPAITDPVYGFGAVNVESQQRNAFSLLNWMRRLLRCARRTGLLAVARSLPAAGNRKILAYLREYEDETILCVANLSRAPQAVELDLSLFKGRVPVELMGRSKFPPVGQLPYLLTLTATGSMPSAWRRMWTHRSGTKSARYRRIAGAGAGRARMAGFPVRRTDSEP